MLEDIQARIDSAKAEMGQERLSVLNDLFDAHQHLPDGVDARRFRADRPSMMGVMDELEGMHTFIERSRAQQERYIVKPYSLPLLDSSRARAIFAMTEKLLPVLREFYRERLTGPVSVEEILEKAPEPENVVRDALYMISEAHAVICGRSTNFPYELGTVAHIEEGVLQRQSFAEVFCQYYDQHINNVRVADSFPGSWLELGEGGNEALSILSAFSASSRKLERLDFLDEAENSLLREIDVALSMGLFSLAIMGIRALIDSFAQRHVPGHKTFAGSLKAMQQGGIISGWQSELLLKVFDAGSAVMHRSHRPSRQDVDDCIQIYVHIILADRELRPRADGLAERTPPR